MPIRPENRDRYPKDWPLISLAVRERAGQKCETCGVPNHELGGRDAKGRWWPAGPTGDNGLRTTWPKPGEDGWCYRDGEGKRLRIVRIVLTVAHLDHTPENCDPANLKALCQRCHNLYDGAHRRAGIRQRQRKIDAVGDLFEGSAA